MLWSIDRAYTTFVPSACMLTSRLSQHFVNEQALWRFLEKTKGNRLFSRDGRRISTCVDQLWSDSGTTVRKSSMAKYGGDPSPVMQARTPLGLPTSGGGAVGRHWSPKLEGNDAHVQNVGVSPPRYRDVERMSSTIRCSPAEDPGSYDFDCHSDAQRRPGDSHNTQEKQDVYSSASQRHAVGSNSDRVDINRRDHRVVSSVTGRRHKRPFFNGVTDAWSGSIERTPQPWQETRRNASQGRRLPSGPSYTAAAPTTSTTPTSTQHSLDRLAPNITQQQYNERSGSVCKRQSSDASSTSQCNVHRPVDTVDKTDEPWRDIRSRRDQNGGEYENKRTAECINKDARRRDNSQCADEDDEKQFDHASDSENPPIPSRKSCSVSEAIMHDSNEPLWRHANYYPTTAGDSWKRRPREPLGFGLLRAATERCSTSKGHEYQGRQLATAIL